MRLSNPAPAGAIPKFAEDWLARDCPVLVRWNPMQAGVPTFDGAHFGVVTEWTTARVVLADPYGGSKGSACELRELSPGPWVGTQAIAVLPPT